MKKNNIWISANEAAEFLNITKMALHKRRKKNMYTTKVVKKRGGSQYVFLLSSLPEDAQLAYAEKHLKKAVKGIDIKKFDEESEMITFSDAPSYQKEKAEKYLSILRACAGLKGSELRVFIKDWNKENPEFSTSYASVLRARKEYKENGINGLLGKYGQSKGMSKVDDLPEDVFEYFKALFLKEGSPSARSCWITTLGYARNKYGLKKDDLPNYRTFERAVYKKIPAPAITLGRKGYAKFNKTENLYIDRDWSGVEAGKVWFSDHAQIDVAVKGDDGKVYFPWFTVWQDARTDKILGWDLHVEAPNSDHIFTSFYRAAKKYGIPSWIYIDNGKDYRSRDFAGGKRNIKVDINKNKTTSMIGLLDIQVKFAKPYRAQSKSIERRFLTIKTQLSKHLVGYRGGNVVERPEILAEQIKKGKILDFRDFEELFNNFIVNALNKLPGEYSKKLNGLSPDQAWNEQTVSIKKVSPEALKLFCMRSSKVVSITRRGVRDSKLKVSYWSDWMAGHKRKKVYIRRDIKAYQEAWVFDASNDEFLGRAELVTPVPAIATTDIEKKQLEENLKRNKNYEKSMKAFIKSDIDEITAEQKVNDYIAGIEAMNGKIEEKDININELSNTRMDQVIQKDKDNQRIGKNDYSKLLDLEKSKKKKRKIYLFEHEKIDDLKKSRM